MKERASELEFLKYFFDKVYHYLGPADDDIVDSIKRSFKKEKDRRLPEGYYDRDEEKEAMEAEEEDVCDDTKYHIHTILEFLVLSRNATYEDEDGFGYLADDEGNELTDAKIYPSSLSQTLIPDPKWTKVHWYSK